MTEKKFLSEKDSIKDLGDQSRNCRNHVDRLNKDYYGFDVPSLINAIVNLADVEAYILRQKGGEDDDTGNCPADKT